MAVNRWHAPLVRASDWAWRILVVLALLAAVVWAGMYLAAFVMPMLLTLAVIPVGRPLAVRFARHVPESLAAALVLLLAVLALFVAG